jgi:hypothetical protein
MAKTYDDEDLIDMKRSKADAKAANAIYTKPAEYGYGLCIRLEDADLDKLGIKTLPQPGEVFMIEAMAVVDSSYQSQSANNKDDRSVSLQIQKLGLTRSMKKS